MNGKTKLWSHAGHGYTKKQGTHIIRRVQYDDNITAYYHDLMERILTQQIRHEQEIADIGTLILDNNSDFQFFPTPIQEARMDHFRDYLIELL
jgi:hypothetical protein